MKPRLIIAVLALVLAAAPSVQAADIFFKGRFGDVSVGVNTGDRYGHHDRYRYRERPRPRPRDGFFGGVVNDIARDQHKAAQQPRRGYPYRRYDRYYGHDRYYGYDRYYGQPAVRAPQEPAYAAPEPAPETPEVARAEPPDARGPSFEAARGQAPRTSFRVGSPLPQGRPHVALDWRDYDLPRPPVGQTYARFDGAVLLIDSGSRVVRQVLWPPAGG